MTYDITLINDNVRQEPARSVAYWEEFYRQRIIKTAEEILAHRELSPVVLLAGPSGSGKTTTATRLVQRLQKRGVTAHLLSMDNYYINRSDPNFPLLPDGRPDLESPLGLDIDLLNEHFAILETGGEIHVPIYDFPTHSRLEGKTIPMDASHGDVFIFEGIHALNRLFTEKHPNAFRIYVSPEDDFSLEGEPFCSPVLMRLMRRTVRDHLFRGAAAEYSLSLWENVLAGEQQYILPFRSEAHQCITTTLPHELGVMKPFALELFHRLPTEVPCRESVDALLNLLEQVESVSARFVPADSILREFIGEAT